MRIEPLDDRVLITVDEEAGPQKTNSGLYLPDTAKEKPRTGVVVAVGTDEDLREKVQVGNRILYSKFSGDEIDLDGRKHLLLQRNEILAIVRD
ncbi:MAG: co-chaperone GroES [Bacillota bacterium]